MGLTAAPMTDAAVRELSRWQYDGEYAVYDESPYEESGPRVLPCWTLTTGDGTPVFMTEIL